MEKPTLNNSPIWHSQELGRVCLMLSKKIGGEGTAQFAEDAKALLRQIEAVQDHIQDASVRARIDVLIRNDFPEVVHGKAHGIDFSKGNASEKKIEEICNAALASLQSILVAVSAEKDGKAGSIEECIAQFKTEIALMEAKSSSVAMPIVPEIPVNMPPPHVIHWIQQGGENLKAA